MLNWPEKGLTRSIDRFQRWTCSDKRSGVHLACLPTKGIAGLITLLLSQVGEVDDLMTVQHAQSCDQPQQPEEQIPVAEQLLLRAFWAATVFDNPALIRWTTSTTTRDLSSTEKMQHIS